MYIRYSKQFLSRFQRLENHDKIIVRDMIDLFREDPHSPILRNHPLEKPMYGQRAFSVRDDLRITFREK